MIPDLPLYEPEADRAVAIFDKLRLADVPGTPRLEDACGDWFRGVVRALLGALDPVSYHRMVRELFLLVPKKNSKTTYGALMMLTALLLNRRPHGQFILTAPVQDVSEIAFEAIAGAIALDDVLDKKLHVRAHLKTIVHRETRAELQVMTFDPAVLTGQKAAGILIDELHVVAKMSKAASAIRQLRGGMLPFPEAFLAFITTQSEDPPSGVFKAELDKARAIRDGQREGAMLPVLYEFPRSIQRDAERWQDPSLWPLVTPNAGRSITIPRLVQEMETARDTSEAELRAWASQHLDVEVGLSLLADRWPGTDFWEACGTQLGLDDVLARSEVVTVGIDGGGLDDMLGLAVLGREVETGSWLLWTHAWIHPVVLERRKREAPQLMQYAEAGDLTVVERVGDDVDQVADLVEKVEDSELLDRIGVDQAGIGSIVDAIVDRGIDFERVVGIPQGWRLNGAIKTTERRLAARTLLHGAQAMMAWCVGNARAEQRGNAITITKQVAGSGKIDPLMATFDAVALMAMNPKPRKARFQLFTLG